MSDETHTPHAPSREAIERVPTQNQNELTRFLGGSLRESLFKLIMMSLIVGVLLSWWGLNPYNILYSLENLLLSIWNEGFVFIHGLWRYLLLGGSIVIPLWILIRLFERLTQK